jgi:integrase
MKTTNRAAALTARSIEGLIAQARTTGEEWANDASPRGVPKLQVRAKADERGDVSVNFYLRYVLSDGNRERMPLGPHDGAGKSGLTLAQARTKADDLRRIYRDVSKDLRDHLEAQQKAAEARAAEEARKARDFNLGELLRAYVRSLCVPGYLIERIDVPVKKGGRTPAPEGASAAGMRPAGRDVVNTFRRYVFLAHPDLVKRPAADITPQDLHAVVAAVVSAGHGRSAAMLRSYLRAAFQSALNAEFDPSAQTTLMGFGLTGNPASALAAMSQFSRALQRTLKEPELRAYMARIAGIGSIAARNALELALLLGGQRPTQLLRVTGRDVDLDAMTVRLEDSKGRRRGVPRQHVLPLTERTAALFKQLIGLNGQGFLFSSDGGGTAMRAEKLSEYVSEIASEMLKAKEAAEDFDLRDIRRTAETMLAGIGVSKDDRAQLLSHGLGGVQDKHYDRHTYDQQKRAALTRWEAHLDRVKHGKSEETVVALRGRGRRA